MLPSPSSKELILSQHAQASSGSKSSLTPLIEQLASPPPTGTAWNGGQSSARRRGSDTGSRSQHGSRDSVATPAARGLSSAPGSREPFNSPFRSVQHPGGRFLGVRALLHSPLKTP